MQTNPRYRLTKRVNAEGLSEKKKRKAKKGGEKNKRKGEQKQESRGLGGGKRGEERKSNKTLSKRHASLQTKGIRSMSTKLMNPLRDVPTIATMHVE